MNSLTTEQTLSQIDAFSTPGSLLRAGREAQEMSQREVADALNLLPAYVGLLENDDYAALRSPAFARGYIKAYGRLLDIGDEQLLPLYDELIARKPIEQKKRIETRPLQLQATGVGVVVGLTTLALLLAMLWWWQGGNIESSGVGNAAAQEAAFLSTGDRNATSVSAPLSSEAKR